MRARLGPYPSEIVTTWCLFARKMLEEVTHEPGAVHLDAGVRQTFESFLDEWEDVAGRSDVFEWSADIPADLLWFLVEAWLPIANYLATSAEARGYALMPAECEPFYRGLIES